jgi:hypothetical protein
MPKREACVFCKKLAVTLGWQAEDSRGGEHGYCMRLKYAKAPSKHDVIVRQFASEKGIRLTMTFKPIDTVILDLTVTCTACEHRIQPNEVVLVAPQSVRCPKCQQVFSPSHSKVA